MLTPRLYAELRKQYLRGQREVHTMLALLRLDVINFSQRAPKELVRIDDILPPESEPEQPPAKRPRLTAKRRQQIADGIRRLFAHCVVVEK